MPRHARCPSCGSDDTVPIVYGFPGGGMFEAEERGEIVLAGCLVGDHDPSWACKGCGNGFGVLLDNEESRDRPEDAEERSLRFSVLTAFEQSTVLRFAEWDKVTQDNLLRWAWWDDDDWGREITREIKDGYYDDHLDALQQAVESARARKEGSP